MQSVQRKSGEGVSAMKKTKAITLDKDDASDLCDGLWRMKDREYPKDTIKALSVSIVKALLALDKAKHGDSRVIAIEVVNERR